MSSSTVGHAEVEGSQSSSSSSAAAAVFGFETFHRTLELKSRADALVAAIHWILVTNGLRCIAADDNDDDGQGSQAEFRDDSASISELLPTGWNDHVDDFYVLKYRPLYKKSAGNVSSVMVKMIFADGVLIVSIVRPADNKTASVSLPLADYILEDFRNFAKAYRQLDDLQLQIENSLLSPLYPRVNVGRETSGCNADGSPSLREERSTRRDDSSFDERHNPPGGPFPRRPDPLGSSFSDDDGPLVPPIGRGDLDPLGRSQGGMLMDPRHFPHAPLRPMPGGIGPERLPRGSVPPGARFDPFGPPIPDQDRRRNPRFAGPDPDHLPPPGYDDMFG